MAQGILTANGSTDWLTPKAGSNGIHIGVSGNFGGGAVTIDQKRNGTDAPLLDGATAISITADDDSLYNLVIGDVFRLTLTGATAPAVAWSINGAYAVGQ